MPNFETTMERPCPGTEENCWPSMIKAEGTTRPDTRNISYHLLIEPESRLMRIDEFFPNAVASIPAVRTMRKTRVDRITDRVS